MAKWPIGHDAERVDVAARASQGSGEALRGEVGDLPESTTCWRGVDDRGQDTVNQLDQYEVRGFVASEIDEDVARADVTVGQALGVKSRDRATDPEEQRDGCLRGQGTSMAEPGLQRGIRQPFGDDEGRVVGQRAEIEDALGVWVVNVSKAAHDVSHPLGDVRLTRLGKGPDLQGPPHLPDARGLDLVDQASRADMAHGEDAEPTRDDLADQRVRIDHADRLGQGDTLKDRGHGRILGVAGSERLGRVNSEGARVISGAASSRGP